MCVVHRLNFVVLHSLTNWCHHRYLKAGKSGMTIMDIGIFSGFTPDKDSLVEVNRKKFLFVCGTSVPLSCSAFKFQACPRGSILAGRALISRAKFQRKVLETTAVTQNMRRNCTELRQGNKSWEEENSRISNSNIFKFTYPFFSLSCTIKAITWLSGLCGCPCETIWF